MKTTRFYYTLKDVFSINLDTYPDTVMDSNSKELGLGEAIVDTLEAGTLAGTRWSTLDNTTTIKMFKEYLWPEFQDGAIIYIDVLTHPWEEPEEPDDEDIIEAFAEKAAQMVRWYQESSDKYSLIISSLAAVQSKLMDQLGTSSVVLFNDTPQSGGDFVSDPYVTNATKTTSSADVATPIARLQEVQQKLRSYYADWADEFSRFVIYSD